ncbi:MAG: YeeE/YedE thiosulfate transporter family protein [Anaeromyxobacter sp.]
MDSTTGSVRPEPVEGQAPKPFWNPYLGGAALGLVLLTAYMVMGKGLGASGASFRLGVAALSVFAPGHAATAPGLKSVAATPFDDWLVFEVLGVVLGGLVGAYTSGRLKLEVLRGPAISAGARIAMALGGGLLMGFAAKLARGCTSGQALSGGAMLSAGSWAFMMMVFAGGYAFAWTVRRAWR